MRRLLFTLFITLASISCTKKIDSPLALNDLSLLEIQIKGQMGTAVIERGRHEASATIFVMEGNGFDYSSVEVAGIVVSYGASASVTAGSTLNFSNPERRAKITVTSGSGRKMDWWIYLKPYDAFYVGTWRIIEIKLCCNQRLANCGDGSWETQLSGSEFGDFGKAEYDNRIIITMNEGVKNNKLSGEITNTPGNDGEYGHFWGVFSPYSKEAPLNMDPRLRHLMPPGTSTWELDLTTNQMKITGGNVTSTMFFGERGEDKLFRFNLPNAGGEPSQNGFYDNMWRSSYELYYEVYKMSN